MVFKLVNCNNSSSGDESLKVVSISYSVTIIDRCCEIIYAQRYQNSSTVPLGLKIENDSSIELGTLYSIESTIGGVGVFEQSSKTYSMQFTPQQTTPSISYNIDLMPGKEIIFNSKYVQELKVYSMQDKSIRLDLPYFNCTDINTTDIRIDGEFSSNIKILKSKSHPSSLETMTIDDCNLSCLYKIESLKDNSIQQFVVEVELQELLMYSGWYSDSLNSDGKYYKATFITFNNDSSSEIENLQVKWNDNNNNQNSNGSNNNNNELKIEKVAVGTIIYNTETSTSENLSESHHTVSLSFLQSNNSNECKIQLKKTNSLLIYRFTTLSYLNILVKNYQTSTTQQQDLTFLIKLFLDIKESPSTSPSSASPLSLSCNSTINNNANSNLLKSTDLLSNISSVPNRVKPPGLQSLTAPPSLAKDMISNPIAAFVNSKQLGSPSALTGPASGSTKQLRRPPTLGGSDIRLQRLASYNKVNQLWNLSMSDFADRHTIYLEELEATALEMALTHVRNNWWERKKGRLATVKEIEHLRSIVYGIVKDSKIEMTYVEVPIDGTSANGGTANSTGESGSNGNGSGTTDQQQQSVANLATSDLSQLLKPQQPPQQQQQQQQQGDTTATNVKKEKMIDIVKLKWVIEEMLEPARSTFPVAQATATTTNTISSSSNDMMSGWYHIDAFETRGERGHMEDKHVVIEHPNKYFGLEGDDSDQLFLGVFDGHNGKLAAEYAKIHLPYEVYRAKKTAPTYEESLTKAYQEVDKMFLKIAEREDKKAGSTIATVIAMRDKLYVSNIGDTEVVLSKAGVARALSTVHTPTNESERERIEKAGGAILQCGTLRVNGILAVTRSLGDKNLKDVIVAYPDNNTHSVEGGDQFIVMATDGLWDVFKHQQVVDFILEQNKLQLEQQQQQDSTTTTTTSTQQQLGNIAERLVEEALKRGSKDNITVIIVYFRDNYTPVIDNSPASAAGASTTTTSVPTDSH